MRRFLAVVLAGIFAGALCGCLFLVLGDIGHESITLLLKDTSVYLALGIMFGAPFGAVAFPLCYYLFLKRVPLTLSLAVTIPATVGAGWIENSHEYSHRLQNPIPDLGCALCNFYILIYGPGFAGLLLASLGLYFGERVLSVKQRGDRPMIILNRRDVAEVLRSHGAKARRDL